MRPIGRHMAAFRGIALVEAAVATMIVAIMLVAALNGVAASRTMRGRVADRVRAQQLALDLMSEILQLGYADPAVRSQSRAAWAYVDDYDGLIDSPPQTKSGNAIADVATWSRTVRVQWADPTTFAPTASTNTGVRLITVTVTRGSLVLATLSAYRTAAWTDRPTPYPDPSTNHAPLAAIAASPLSGSGGQLTVNFSAAASSDPDGDAMTYAWSFGDGTSSAGPTASHAYSAAGVYTATLAVSDGKGGVGMSAVNVVVGK